MVSKAELLQENDQALTLLETIREKYQLDDEIENQIDELLGEEEEEED